MQNISASSNKIYHSSNFDSEWEQAVKSQNSHLHSTATQDQIAARIRMVTTRETSKNPLSFTDPTDRMAATLAKAQRVVHSNWYQKLPQRFQNLTKQAYYESYVIPAYKAGNFPIPDKNTWMREIDKTDQDPRQYYEPLGWRNYDHYAYSAIGTVGNIFNGMTRAGIWLGQNTAMASLKLNNFFASPSNKKMIDFVASQVDPQVDQQKQAVKNISNHVFDNVNFWLQTHPNQSLSDKIGSLTGETIVQLPLYASIDKGLEVVKVGTKLTEILEATPTGKFIGSRLTEAASGYLGSLLQNGSAKENLNAALMFMGFGTTLEAPGKIITAGSSMLAKKFTANVLSIGGRPFQQAITDQAIQEMAEIHHIVPDDVVTPELIQHLRNEDKVKFDLLSAEKGVLNSLSLVQFGKTFGKLEDTEKVAVKIARANQVKEAITEAPIHLPDIAKANTDQELADQRKSNPQLDQTINYLEQKYGGKVSDQLVDTEATDIKEQTGISNIQATTNNVGKAVAAQTKEDTEALSKAAEEEPRQYVSFKANNLAYFRNPSGNSGKQTFDYSKWLEGMSDKDFDSEVRDHVGNHWFFEDPKHLMTWAYQYRDQMPKEFRQKIEERLSDLDPTGTPKSWNTESKNMERHLEKLADTGKLFTQGNIYRSSKFDSWGTRTKWQKELNNKDLEKAERLNLQKSLKPYETNFPQQILTAQTTLKNLQMLRRKAIDADEDLSLTTNIKTFKNDVTTILRKMKRRAN